MPGMGGAFCEGWAVIEAHKAFAEAGRRAGLYHWRSHDGLEVDLLVESGAKLIPVEIKQTATPLPGHASGLLRLAELLGPESGAPLLVCSVAAKTALPSGVTALPWREFPAWLRQVVPP